MTMDERLVQIVPHERQVKFRQLEFYGLTIAYMGVYGVVDR